MSYDLQAIRRAPLGDLEPHHHFVIEVHKLMTDIRAAANDVRIKGTFQFQHGYLRYEVGRLHGYVFGMSCMSIYQGWHWLVEEVGDAAMNEADFLTGSYQ